MQHNYHERIHMHKRMRVYAAVVRARVQTRTRRRACQIAGLLFDLACAHARRAQRPADGPGGQRTVITTVTVTLSVTSTVTLAVTVGCVMRSYLLVNPADRGP